MKHPVAALQSNRRAVNWWVIAVVLALAIIVPMNALPSFADSGRLQQLIPILGLTTDEHAVGTVIYLALSFEERTDRSGLIVHFQNGPGHFSRMAQTSTDQAIRRAARSLGLSTDSWSVTLAVPYAGTTIYGESLSGMVGVSVAAMAMGYAVPSGVVMTGTITSDGGIGLVGGVPLKVEAAEQARMWQVLVPDQTDPADADWNTPFLLRVSPIRTVKQALAVLTRWPHSEAMVQEQRDHYYGGGPGLTGLAQGERLRLLEKYEGYLPESERTKEFKK